MKKWQWQFILVLAAIFAVNHAEYYVRAQRLQRQAQAQDVPVIQVVNTAAGHNAIQIDEQTQRSGYLYFSTLEAWNYSKEAPAPCPPTVLEANGHKVKLTGFMYPLQDAANLTVFCLLRSTQTCCYGPRPQFNQYVFVEMPRAVKFERLAPVVVEGAFHIDPKPDEGYIYRMDGESVRSAVPNDQPASAGEVARQNHLPIFDFAPLEAAKTAADAEAAVGRLAADWEGKPMVLQGFIVGRVAGSPAKIMIGKYAWDGKAVGIRPSVYNTVLVSPQGAGDVPPVWWQEAVFRGTLHVTKEPAQRAKSGIVGMEDAVLAVAPASAGALVDGGPLLPWSYEYVMLAACGGVLAIGQLSKGTRPAAGGKR